jgi:hypothetical protein
MVTRVFGIFATLTRIVVAKKVVTGALLASITFLPYCGGGGSSSPSPPSISSISPDGAMSSGGMTVTIYGNNFQNSNGSGVNINYVQFNGQNAYNINVQNNNQMTVTIPSGPGGTNVGVVISTNGGTSNTYGFWYGVAPVPVSWGGAAGEKVSPGPNSPSTSNTVRWSFNFPAGSTGWCQNWNTPPVSGGPCYGSSGGWLAVTSGFSPGVYQVYLTFYFPMGRYTVASPPVTVI